MIHNDEAEKRVVSVTNIFESPVIWIKRVSGRQLLDLCPELLRFFSFSLLFQANDLCPQCFVFQMGTPSVSSVVFWKEHLFNILIKFVQIDIAEYWRDYAALWASGERSVIFPVLN